MITKGFAARLFGDFEYTLEDEIEFAKANGFSFLQIYFDTEGKFELRPPGNMTERLRQFPVIIHACCNVEDIPERFDFLSKTLKQLGHNELILHPASKAYSGEDATDCLIQNLKRSFHLLQDANIQLFIENNSNKDGFLVLDNEIQDLFQECPSINFLLDIAHVEDMAHLDSLIKVKKPAMLHISDRHTGVIHEHLPVGQGDIDFKKIFAKKVPAFSGKIVIEVTKTDEELSKSKEIIASLINKE